MIFRWALMDVAQEWLGNVANLNEPAKSKQFINRCVLGACLDHQISGKKINWYLGGSRFGQPPGWRFGLQFEISSGQ